MDSRNDREWKEEKRGRKNEEEEDGVEDRFSQIVIDLRCDLLAFSLSLSLSLSLSPATNARWLSSAKLWMHA